MVGYSGRIGTNWIYSVYCAAHATLPVLPLDDVKVGAPASEESSIPSSSMAVSSTTKIGDDGLVQNDFPS